MANGVLPIRIGFLYDYPQGDGCSPTRCGSVSTRWPPPVGIDRDFEFVEDQARGLPSGSEHDIKRVVRRARRSGRGRDHRTVDLRQRADRRAALRRGPHPRDQLLGRRAHAVAVDVPLPGRIARGGAAGARGSAWSSAGSQRAAVVFDQSPVGRRYAEYFEAARGRLGLEVTGTASISSLAENADDILDPPPRRQSRRARVPRPRRVVARGRARARRSSAGTSPVLANSALMFGYARPDWRDGYAGWEYVDTIADDNVRRAVVAQALAPTGWRPHRLRRLRHGAAARRGSRAVRPSDPCRHRRRAAPGEAAPGDERLRRNAHGLRHVGARRLKGHYLVLREWRDGRSVQVQR